MKSGKIFRSVLKICFSTKHFMEYIFALVFLPWVLFFIASKCNLKESIKLLYMSLPACLVGVTSMSSMVSLPLVLQVLRSRMNNPNLSNIVIPMTINIQQVGDCFFNIFICSTLFYALNGTFFSLKEFLIFLPIYAFSRFGGLGIVGGVIFFMLPLYEEYFKFNMETLSLILALNIIFDPIITAVNILTNISLCILFEKVLKLGVFTFFKKSVAFNPRGKNKEI